MNSLNEKITAEALYRRIRIAIMVTFILFIVMFVRLFQLSIIEGKTYKILSENNRQRILFVEPERGIIYDRNGIPLVKNEPYFVAAITAEEINERELSAIAAFLGISEEEIKERLKNRKSQIEPVVIKEGLSFEEVARLEARQSDFPDISVLTTTIRRYLYGTVGAHLIGYLGRLTETQWDSLKSEGIPPDAFIGQWGVEKIFDSVLRGKFGKKIVEVDALGHEIRMLGEIPPERGQDIHLSIDINLQKAMEEAYGTRRGAFVALRPETGEVLALGSLPSFDPNKFARGAASDYWNKLLEDEGHPLLNRAFQSQYPPGSVYKIVTAIAGLEKGIIKPTTTFHCSGGITFGNRFFRCWKKEGHGTVDLKRAIIESCDVYFYEVGKRVGIDNIAEYARRLGLGDISGINLVSEKKGIVPSSEWKLKSLGQPWYPGETLSASIGQGYVSVTPAQLARMIAAIVNGGYLKKFRLLKSEDGSPQNLTILGDMSKTGSITVTFATDNQQVKENSPQLLLSPPTDKVKTVAISDIKDNNESQKINISQQTLIFIKDALTGVVNEPGGTGGAARLGHILVGGKTGTAQVISKAIDTHKLTEKFRDHAWFVAFAPADRPAIAMAIFVEHGGHGGSAAAPIARIGIEKYLSNENSKTAGAIGGEVTISEGD